MKVIVLPREASNPYQDLLYRELAKYGVRVSYVGAATPSHTANLILLPLQLLVRRISGTRILHIHWVYTLGMYGRLRTPVLNWAAQCWFGFCLRVSRLLGIRVTWTAHNVLPHSPVFADDLRARRTLVAAADMVIAHSPETLTQLRVLGIVPRRTRVIPHGPLHAPPRPDRLRIPGSDQGPRQLLFFGKVIEYKGVEELLTAITMIPLGRDAQLTVAGECSNPVLRTTLTELAAHSPVPVVLRLERVPDGEVTDLLSASDAVVLPYRHITTSGSAMLAFSHGRPLVVPDLPSLAGLPDGAVFRYDRTVAGLAGALDDVICADSDLLAKMSAVALSYSTRITWSEIAEQTLDALRDLSE